MAKRKTPWPRCTASSWRGECGTAVARGEDGKPDPSGLCEHHAANPPAEPSEPAAVVDEAPAIVELPASEVELSERVADIRGQLREDISTAEVYELIRDSLVSALAATRETWLTCTACKHKQPVTLPDLSTRVNAIDKLLSQTLGKLAEVKDSASAPLEARAREIAADIAGATDDELAWLAAHDERESVPTSVPAG